MLKKPVVALALFAALISTQAFAQNLVVSAGDAASGSPQVPVTIFNHGVALSGSCVEVRFYGTNLLGALRGDAPIISTTVNGGSLAPGQQAQLTASMPWVTYARMLGLKGPLYFKASIRWTTNDKFQMAIAPSNGLVFTVFQ